jgi:predicted Zn-dependent peptidase
MQLNVKSLNVSIYLTMKSAQRFVRLTYISTAFLTFLLVLSVSAQGPAKKPREETLLNGLKVLMWPDNGAKDVAVKIRIHSGAAFDPQGKEGVMRMLADNIFPTAESREYFSEELGGYLRIETTYDYIEISSASAPDKLLPLLETLSSALLNPTIDKATTAQLRESLTNELRPLEGDTAYVADQAAAKRLFGTFPYGRPVNGSVDSVKNIEFPDLIDAKQRFLTADNATMTVVGNFNGQRAWQAIRRYFGPWLKSDRRVPSTFRQPDPPMAERFNVASPKRNESAFRYVVRVPARNDKGSPVARVYAELLEARLAARIPESLEEKVFVRLDEHLLFSTIMVGFSAARNDVGTSAGKIAAMDLLSKAMTDPITEAEFAAAKSAARAEWDKRDPATLWLDADTFKTAGAAAEMSAFDRVALADVQAFAGRLRAAENVSVLVNTPSK